MKKTLVLVAYLLLASVLGFCQKSDPVFQWAVKASGYDYHSDIIYKRANGQDIKLDVISIEPTSQPRPTLLYIYGGGWVNGSKGSVTLAPLPYLSKGMNVVNINYRLASESLAPAAVEDCRCAFRWIYRNAKKYGFDTNKLIIAGESAGGHLALITAMLQQSDGFDNECLTDEPFVPLKAAAVVSYSGPTDVADLLQGEHQLWAAQKWFGSQPNQMELARRLSPISHVHPGLPLIIMAHGDTDPYVPYSQIVHLRELLDKAKVPNEVVLLHRPTHGWAIEKELSIEEQVFDLLKKYGILDN